MEYNASEKLNVIIIGDKRMINNILKDAVAKGVIKSFIITENKSKEV